MALKKNEALEEKRLKECEKLHARVIKRMQKDRSIEEKDLEFVKQVF